LNVRHSFVTLHGTIGHIHTIISKIGEVLSFEEYHVCTFIRCKVTTYDRGDAWDQTGEELLQQALRVLEPL
jgi:hypothetical protein